MTKKLLALATVLALLCSSTLSAYAAEYNLDEGSVTITANESGQMVKHGDKEAVSDTAPIITQKDPSVSTGNTITIKTEDNATANVTIKDVNIKTGEVGKSGIEVGSSDAAITVEGNNTVSSRYSAGIHVSSGSLTITGNGELDVKENGNLSKGCAAAIGSNKMEEMSGSISIKGEAKVTATTTSAEFAGAGIGSGQYGDMSGEINIENNATVSATCHAAHSGAAIGSGSSGDITESGSISTKDEAKVTATATGESDSGAGIGSGILGDMSGKIDIENNATVNATSSARTSGAGIGSGREGEMSGTISISTKATVDAGSTGERYSGEAIGAGAKGTNTGTIRYFDPDPEPTAPSSVACYRVVDENGLSVGYTSAVKDGVLTITAQRDKASLIITLAELKLLSDRGVKTIVFITDGAASALPVSDLLALAKLGDSLCLTHKGEEVTLTLNGETLTDVRKPWPLSQQ